MKTDRQPYPGLSKEKRATPLSRRSFLRFSGGLLGTSLIYFLLRPNPASAGVLPPGALAESAFREACLRCGKCAVVCDSNAIQLDKQGFPYIDGLKGWCNFCLCCVEACPVEALGPLDPDTAKIGTVVIDRDRCIAWRWIGCRLCAEECANLQQAIWLDDDLRPYVNAPRCNGCGACVFVCPQSDIEGRHRRYGKAVSLHNTGEGWI